MVRNLIICEGKNDKTFLEQFLNHLNINSIDVEFLNRDSKNKSAIFKKEKYNQVLEELGTIYKNLLIIFDSDYKKNDLKYGGYENSQREIEFLIKELKLENIADYYIFCDPISQDGYLESLILSTISNEQRECINSFLECSNYQDKEKDKAIYNQLYKLGYPNKPYDFSHKNFDLLQQKIKNLKE